MIKKRKMKGSQRLMEPKKLKEDENRDELENNNEENEISSNELSITKNKEDNDEPQLNLPEETSSKKINTNSKLTSSTKKQNKLQSTNFHDSIIKANREEKESDYNLRHLTTSASTDNDQNDSNKDVGPKRISNAIKVSSRMDYQPDICKDYYETGFCGYGDNCKFAHVREEHVNSIQLTKRWEKEQKKKEAENLKALDQRGTGKEDIPHACFICRKPFKDPIVTNCGHYFCEKCAIERYNGGKNPYCACCGANTHGVFNTPKKKIK
ncbi:hypothetical protein ABK040_008097 [Willaertia magna]